MLVGLLVAGTAEASRARKGQSTSDRGGRIMFRREDIAGVEAAGIEILLLQERKTPSHPGGSSWSGRESRQPRHNSEIIPHV